ncbi:MAG: zinc ribbon domain-containing protein [Syntrophales bacterium]|nr:zinc ribbon domain-containing protein [Syntrophales bacterium]
MPIYEYECEGCGAINEFIVFDDHEALQCKSCQSGNLRKLMSAHNTATSNETFAGPAGGGCCGSPHSCGTPGSCCGG